MVRATMAAFSRAAKSLKTWHLTLLDGPVEFGGVGAVVPTFAETGEGHPPLAKHRRRSREDQKSINPVDPPSLTFGNERLPAALFEVSKTALSPTRFRPCVRSVTRPSDGRPHGK